MTFEIYNASKGMWLGIFKVDDLQATDELVIQEAAEALNERADLGRKLRGGDLYVAAAVREGAAVRPEASTLLPYTVMAFRATVIPPVPAVMKLVHVK
jgi:hypothetical protein